MGVIILAGGLSTRMGKDKASLVLGNVRILQVLADRFSESLGPVLVVERPGQGVEVSGAAVIQDVYQGAGPLGGIHAGLNASDDEVNLVVACDMPFASVDLGRFLISKLDDHDSAVPMLGRGPEPLFSVYRKAILPVMEENLKAGKLKMRFLLDGIDTLYISEHEIQTIDPELRSFTNINTPEELEEVANSE